MQTKGDYLEGLNRLEIVLDAQPETAYGAELVVLGIFIDDYEQEYHLIGYPDPIEAVKFRMEQDGLQPK